MPENAAIPIFRPSDTLSPDLQPDQQPELRCLPQETVDEDSSTATLVHDGAPQDMPHRTKSDTGGMDDTGSSDVPPVKSGEGPGLPQGTLSNANDTPSEHDKGPVDIVNSWKSDWKGYNPSQHSSGFVASMTSDGLPGRPIPQSGMTPVLEVSAKPSNHKYSRRQDMGYRLI